MLEARPSRAARVLRVRRDGPQVLRERQRESVHQSRRRAVPLVPRPAGRRTLDHVGPPGLSLERPRFHGEREGRPRQRLADPLRRHRALVLARRALHRHHRRARRAVAAPRRRVPPADADDVRRAGRAAEDPQGVRRRARHDDRPRGDSHEGSQRPRSRATTAVRASAAASRTRTSTASARRFPRRRRRATSRCARTASSPRCSTIRRRAARAACA